MGGQVPRVEILRGGSAVRPLERATLLSTSCSLPNARGDESRLASGLGEELHHPLGVGHEGGQQGLRKLTAQQSSDFYDVLVERDRRAATIIMSNRAVDEWVA